MKEDKKLIILLLTINVLGLIIGYIRDWFMIVINLLLFTVSTYFYFKKVKDDAHRKIS